MAITVDVLNSLVSITQFNKGQASKIFDRLHNERQIVVLKNNAPSAVILSPKEYERMSEVEENYHFLLLAQQRMENNNFDNAVTFEQAMVALGISATDIEEAEDLEIE